MRTRTPTRLGRSLACLLVGLTAAAFPAVHAADAAKSDAHGDALPDGALARLGTLRWRAGNTVMLTAFLPDGKGLLTVSQDYVARVWELKSGKELRHFDVAGAAPTGPNVARFYALNAAGGNAAVSADGKSLACAGRDGSVRVWEVATGKEVRKFANSQPYFRGGVALSGDGKALATVTPDQRVALYNVSDGKEIRTVGNAPQATGTRLIPYKMTLSADGKTLVAGGLEFDKKAGGLKTAFVVWDATTGKEVQRITEANAGGAIGVMTAGISPDGKFAAMFSGTKVKLYDLASGKVAKELEGAADAFTSLIFTPDGKSLVGMTGRNEALSVWDVATGKAVKQFGKLAVPAGGAAAYGPAARNGSVSPDGKLLSRGDGPAVRVVDLTTGKERVTAAGHAGGVRGVLFTRDGKGLLTWADDQTVRRWGADGKEAGEIKLPAKAYTAVVPAPDGRTVAAVEPDSTGRLIDAATGKETHALKTQQPAYGRDVAFSPDSRLLATVHMNSPTVQLFDVASGKEKHTLTFPMAANVSAAPDAKVFVNTRGPRRVAFSPDGRHVAASDTGVTVWEVAGGKEEWNLPIPQGMALRHLAFSPDGRTLAFELAGGQIEVWELASGKRRLTLNPKAVDPQTNMVPGATISTYGVSQAESLAFAPDGRLLAQAGEDQKTHLWDLRAGKEVGTLAGHRGALSAVAFAPDGKRLATASADTTALVWDAAPLLKKLPATAAPVAADKLDGLWAQLAEADGRKGYGAVCALAGDPAKAVPYLTAKLKPAAVPDAKRVTRLIADLDSDEFSTREDAHRELAKLGELALPAIRAALKAEASAEQRRALELLLNGAEARGPSPERLRLLRALEALEMAATPGAVKVLKSLGAGAPEALPTTQAKDVLRRLGQAEK